MNTAALVKAISERAERLGNCDERPLSFGELCDDAELLRCLARMVAGWNARRAFGAPGDWGYNTPIGAALADIPLAKEGSFK